MCSAAKPRSFSRRAILQVHRASAERATQAAAYAKANAEIDSRDRSGPFDRRVRSADVTRRDQNIRARDVCESRKRRQKNVEGTDRGCPRNSAARYPWCSDVRIRQRLGRNDRENIYGRRSKDRKYRRAKTNESRRFCLLCREKNRGASGPLAPRLK